MDKRRILVIEDDFKNMKLIRAILENGDYAVLEATDNCLRFNFDDGAAWGNYTTHSFYKSDLLADDWVILKIDLKTALDNILLVVLNKALY